MVEIDSASIRPTINNWPVTINHDLPMQQIPYEVGTVVPPLEAVYADGKKFVLDSITGNGVLLIFLRHINCISCQHHLAKVKSRNTEIEKLGYKVVVVTLSQPWVLKMYQETRSFPFTFVADPQLKLYHDFGLERATVGRMFRPGVLWHYTSIVFRGWWVRMPKKDEDVLQLGGDFILNSERKLVFAHRCRVPSDRPSAKQLVRELEKQTPKA
jgi:peroxiredoxin Q/BCP